MTGVYLVAGFQRSSSTEVDAWASRFRWTEKLLGETGCHGHVANVEDAPNVQLAIEDRVWLSFADRIEAFEHAGEFYIVAFS